MSKIEAFWENATADDVAGIVKTGKPIPARFRDEGSEDWQEYSLAGWKLRRLSDVRWIDSDGTTWNQCQVYREPSWHANKPDPGPGWRLLEKYPDEPKLATDEALQCDKTTWNRVRTDSGTQDPGVWYRRRIEPVEAKFSVGQTVRVVGPKATDTKQWSEEMNKHLGKESAVSNRENKRAGWFYELGCSATWAFREDYLEAVEPVEHCSGKPEANIELIAGDTFRHPSGLLFTITAKGFEVTQ
jgi:hypothetical protein